MLASPEKTLFNVPKDQIRKVVLNNGMTILAFKNSAAPKVLVQIAYDVGSAVEQSHERGLAHLVEHMIFKGTEKLSEGDIDAIACKFGAGFNAYTSNDVTSYYFQSNSANWQHFVNILFDCMKNARFDEQHLASELKAVVQELNMYRDDHSSSIVEKAFSSAFPANHPYHFPVIGFKEELATITAKDLKIFYDKYYHPERATLFLVGDLDLEKDVDVVANIFAALPATTSAPRPAFPPMIAETATTKFTIYQDIAMPYDCMYWAIPGRTQPGFEAANTLSSILASGQGSRLSTKLVDVLQIADSIDCGAHVLEQAGLFLIFFVPKPGKTEECYQVIADELDNIIQNGITTEELQRAVAGEVRCFLTTLESHSQLVSNWIDSFFVHRDEFEFFHYKEKLEALTPAILNNYFKTNLNPFFAGKIDLLPLPEHARPLWQEANAKIRDQELDILRKHVRTSPVEKPNFVHSLPSPNKFELNFPKPTADFTLPCGLRVLVREDKKLPIVCTTFAFKDGEYFSQAKEGFAVDLMTDMLFERSVGFSKSDNLNCLDALGAAYNVSEQSGYFVVTTANFAETLAHFFRILTTPDFKQDNFEKIREIELNEIERQQDSPKARANNLLSQDLFAGTDYAWSFEDATKFVEQITLADIKAKHEAVVHPAKIVVAVAGDVDATTVKAIFEKLTQNWQYSKEIITRQIPTPKTGSSLDAKISMYRDQAVLFMGRGGALDFFHQDSVGIRLLNKIIFESLGSRIYRLREQTGLFYRAFGGFSVGQRVGKGLDYVGAILNPENVAKTISLIEDVFADLRENGVTQYELDAAKQMTAQNFISFVANNAVISSTLSSLTLLGADFDYYEKTWQKIQALDLSTINALAKKYCTLDGMAKIQAGAV